MATPIGTLRGFETQPYKSQPPVQGFVHNGTHYYVSGSGYSKKVDEPGRSTRYVSIFRDEYEAAYGAYIRDLLGDDLDALEEAQDMRDDIAANAPPGY